MSDSTCSTNPIADTLSALRNYFGGRDLVATESEIISRCTTEYLAAIDPTVDVDPRKVESQLLSIVTTVFRAENLKVNVAAERHRLIRRLTAWQVAQVMMRLHHVVRLAYTGTTRLGSIALYADGGPAVGTYVVDEDALRRVARQYNLSLTKREFDEIFAVLIEDAPRAVVNSDRDLIAVNNGIIDYRTKCITPFDPSIVLLAKIRVDYQDSPINPVITRKDGTTWDVESWMEELSDDPERVDLAWHVLGAVIRPHVRWNKGVMMFNESGNNGKGTFMSICRNLVGPESFGTLSIVDFEDRFRLPEIVNKTAFGADENDVGAFSEKMANFKAVVTGDIVKIERKGLDPWSYLPSGLVIQCLNSLPKFKDTSNSNYRRLLFWPFDKTFTGREDKAIKDDFLKRPDVLEYVLWRVLHLPDFYELPEPVASKAVLADFKEHNDTVREFWAEIEPELVWDLLPQEFLHDLYIAWSERTNPRGGGLKRREFSGRLKAIIAESGGWEDGQHGVSDRMRFLEPLVNEYGLERWTHRTSRRPKYRGLLRLPHSAVTTTKED